METYRYNTLRFFRVQFGLPARMPLEWCVVRETSRAGSELRLGVALKGTGLYIDVAMPAVLLADRHSAHRAPLLPGRADQPGE